MVDRVERRLSEMAQARQQADLPGLLGALQRRRRRRRAARATVLALGLVGALLLWPRPRDEVATPVAPPPPLMAQPSWTMVADDPQVVARLRVATVVRPEWFVDDGQLQALLRAGDRPDGLVRARGQVLVSAAAVDPFPRLSP